MKCSKTDIHILPSLHSVSCVATADGEGSESSATLAISYEQREGNNHNMHYHMYTDVENRWVPTSMFLPENTLYLSICCLRHW